MSTTLATPESNPTRTRFYWYPKRGEVTRISTEVISSISFFWNIFRKLDITKVVKVAMGFSGYFKRYLLVVIGGALVVILIVVLLKWWTGGRDVWFVWCILKGFLLCRKFKWLLYSFIYYCININLDCRSEICRSVVVEAVIPQALESDTEHNSQYRAYRIVDPYF